MKSQTDRFRRCNRKLQKKPERRTKRLPAPLPLVPLPQRHRCPENACLPALRGLFSGRFALLLVQSGQQAACINF